MVLRTQWIQHVPPVFALQRDDFPTSTTHIGVNIECFPQMVDRRRTRLSTHIEEDTNIGL